MTYAEYITRKQWQYGEKFSDAELWPQFRPYFHGGRVRVRTTYSSGAIRERTGTVSATTGWRPAFILMSNSRSLGSSDLLSQTDQVVAIKRGRVYVAVQS